MLPGQPKSNCLTRPADRANPDHWDRLLKLIDRQDLIGDKRYLTPADRVEREAEVDEVISMWTRKHTKLDAMKLVGDAGIPAGAVLDTDELNKDVTFEQRGIMQTMTHPSAPAVQDAGLAGARRWEGHAHHIVPHARRAHGPSAERLAGSDCPGGGGDEARRRDLTREEVRRIGRIRGMISARVRI
jgi:crotonobetainyl-CoA:carnitine CoA-transferase CaiB-like acyl-CoA transferase